MLAKKLVRVIRLFNEFRTFQERSNRAAREVQNKQQRPEQVEHADKRKVAHFHLISDQRIEIDVLFGGSKHSLLRRRLFQNRVDITIDLELVAHLEQDEDVRVHGRLRRPGHPPAKIVNIVFILIRVLALEHVLFVQMVQKLQDELTQIVSEQKKPEREKL